MYVVPIQTGVDTVTFDFDLELQLAFGDQFVTHSAADLAPGAAKHAIRPSRRQLSTPDRLTSLLD